MTNDPTGDDAAPLRAGDWVRPEAMPRAGRIVRVEPERNLAQVDIGGAVWSLKLDRLRRCKPPAAGPGAVRGPRRKPRHEVDLHGMRVEPALAELDRFLDAAVVDGLATVKIIHGHGEGRLRDAVRETLATHPRVEAFAFGAPAQGGLAVTMATMRLERPESAD